MKYSTTVLDVTRRGSGSDDLFYHSQGSNSIYYTKITLVHATPSFRSGFPFFKFFGKCTCHSNWFHRKYQKDYLKIFRESSKTRIYNVKSSKRGTESSVSLSSLSHHPMQIIVLLLLRNVRHTTTCIVPDPRDPSQQRHQTVRLSYNREVL